MTEFKMGYVEDRNGDETAVSVDFDYSGHGIDDNAVVLKAKDNCYPNVSVWLTPKDARKLADMLSAAASMADTRNEKALQEEAEYRGYVYKPE